MSSQFIDFSDIGEEYDGHIILGDFSIVSFVSHEVHIFSGHTMIHELKSCNRLTFKVS